MCFFCLDFYSSQQFQSWNPNDDVGDCSKDNSAAFSNCIPGFVSRQRLILINIKDKEVRLVHSIIREKIMATFIHAFDNIVIIQ